MNGAAADTSALKDDGWQVPQHRVDFWHGRTKACCVVIPVLNEGERVRGLLRQMKEMGTETVADTIVVDGGSTDGSLDGAFLESMGVTGLITKQGPGRLSAQLRCAYAHALRQGYEGIVTIDGNGKDAPTPIPAFVRALVEDGYDFVQASRFIPGGVAENTPLSRDLAIRLVHAPVLRVASGFPWTDTTQGFRGYSARALLDDRVKPFRDIFGAYELLAYLSYRLPKLGFRCIELPTSRRYPQGEVPTKINGMRGNLTLLRVLFEAALGRYNP